MSIKWLWHKHDFFVEMIPRSEDHKELLGQTLKSMGIKTIDKQKHWEGSTRRAIVKDINPDLRTEVQVGDVILLEASAGFTMDGDLLDGDGFDEYGKGESHRWLRENEVLAIEEREVAHV